MRQHGGVLEIDSQDGSGTSARVRFPVERVVWLHECSGDTEISDMPSRALEKAASPSINPVRTAGRPLVLVVEDDRELRELLRRMLEHSGFATVAASNGRKALHYLSAEPVALLITDMVMPDMDGIELLRVLQTERPELPVIALSGVENFNEYHRIAMHLGARAALRKPVTRADLTSAVNKVLGLPLADSYAEHEPSPA